MTYLEAVQYLYDRLPVFHHIGGSAYKPGLGNTTRLLNTLHNPQNNYKTIHIAGTNGKGSISHMLASVLQKAGYKTGLYTSPHLVDFGERIRINGEKISPDYVVEFVEKNKEELEKIQPSFFEATMAMAFKYFSDEKVDVAVIEVGLGGRLDSTNIINPELSVITNISKDHTEFLGDTLEKIAFEKAGIIKPNIPVVIGETLPETKQVFIEEASKRQAPIIFAENSLQILSHSYKDGKMIVEINDENTYSVGLTGAYQLKNVVTVLTAVNELKKGGFQITEQNIKQGLNDVIEETGLMGRWQVVQQNQTVILDTGHNTAGLEYVVQQLKECDCPNLRIVFGMVNDKDISAVLEIMPENAIYYFTQANIARALPSNELQKMSLPYNLKGNNFASVEEAVNTALKDSENDDIIFIGGSNFVVGEALAFLNNK